MTGASTNLSKHAKLPARQMEESACQKDSRWRLAKPCALQSERSHSSLTQPSKSCTWSHPQTLSRCLSRPSPFCMHCFMGVFIIFLVCDRAHSRGCSRCGRPYSLLLSCRSAAGSCQKVRHLSRRQNRACEQATHYPLKLWLRRMESWWKRRS